MRLKDIEAVLDEFEGGWGELAELDGERVEGIPGYVTGIERQGGAIGDREYSHVVIKIQFIGAKGEARFFKKVGCYTSYSGTTWDGPFTEVKLREKVLTVWE